MNHFIELGYDEWDDIWIAIHSGSRGLGHEVATKYMEMAAGGKDVEGHHGWAADSELGKQYIMDQKFCEAYALANRWNMIENVIAVLRDFGLVTPILKSINRNHNHVEYHDGMYIHRKGATQAKYGYDGVIPGCMRDGFFVVRGKGNADSLWSSSHGAGRVLGRFKAKKVLNMEDFESEMEGIAADVSFSTLDESAGAYKDIHEVMAQQEDLVEVVNYVQPLINVKG
jgi:tRNA-splicing ligase RtcB (3'-phosphate/5'-hydroxy nucleic acid ligase)